MPSGRTNEYQRGEFWLDYVRGASGIPASDRWYIWWYDSAAGRQRRKTTGTSDFRLACDLLDAHYVAKHRPTRSDQIGYTVSEALIDYYVAHGQHMTSAVSIRSRLKTISRFIDYEVQSHRIEDPFLVSDLNEGILTRFRRWAIADPIVARKKDSHGNWVDGKSRPRTAATVEESIIQLKAALRFAMDGERVLTVPELKHKPRDSVTPARNYRLDIQQIAAMFQYAFKPNKGDGVPTGRLMPLRRYLIAAVTTVGRPDAILDMSTIQSRGQWMRNYGRFDLNPEGRIQTKKYRPVIPVCDVLASWLEASDQWVVCNEFWKPAPQGGEPVRHQTPVSSIRSAWDTMTDKMGIPAGWGPKLLRYSMATILAARGVNPLEIEVLLGHRIMSKTSSRYVILLPDYLATFQKTIPGILQDIADICGHPLEPKT